MLARTLLLALLVGAAGGGLAGWALTAAGGSRTADSAPLIEREPAAGRGAEPSGGGDMALIRADPGPTLQGDPRATDGDVAWKDALEARLLRMEGQLEDLAQRVAALDDGKTEPDLDALSDEELTARASSLFVFKNYAGTLKAYEALLARDPELDEDARSGVLSRIAQCHRALGDTKQADEVYRQVEALHGPGTAGAMTARYQRAWLRHAENDLEGAREFMRQVARSDSSPTFWRLFSRANAADFSIRLGDTAHVRGDLEEFKAELEGDDSQTAQRVRGYVDTLLEQLDG